MAELDDPAGTSLGRYSIPGKDGKTARFAAPLLGQDLVNTFPCARNDGAWLYAYYGNADGESFSWHDDGDEFYRAMIRERMGPVWQPGHTNSTMQWIADGAPHLDNAPPADRIRVRNGVLHLDPDGPRLDGHSLDPLTPVALPVTYDPEATCPSFQAFIGQALSATVGKTAQEIMGYILVPDNSQQKAVLAIGKGGNGKSVWLRVCRELIGAQNCSTRSLQALADDRFASADLYGKLVNIYADLSSNELSSSSLFRMITGGDGITAERKMKPSFQFVPFVRLLFSANQYPAIANPMNAVFDRWVVLPFNRRFRGQAEEDKRLINELIAPNELSGILNYALDGLYRLRAQDEFTISVASARALDRFRTQADNVAIFLSERPGLTKGEFVKSNALWLAYQSWNEESGHAKVNRNKFYERVEALKGGRIKLHGSYGWRL